MGCDQVFSMNTEMLILEYNTYNTLFTLHSRRRLNGSYEALVSGKIQDALVDLTAGVGEVIPLQDRSKVPKGLFRLMANMEEANTLMGCSISVNT